jgi:hypothetical protein
MHLLTISRTSWFCNNGAYLKQIRAYENCLPPFYFPTLLLPLVSLPGYLIVFLPKMPCSAASRIHVFPTTASPFFKLTLYCSLSHNWHLEFHDIQIDRRTCALVGSTLLSTWAVLRVHSCTRALLSRHRPNASPFHTQKLLQPRIPTRRCLHWTSVVPWPANNTVTSVIYKFAVVLRSYPLPYYGPPIMPSSVVHIFALKTSEKYNLTVGSSHI